MNNKLLHLVSFLLISLTMTAQEKPNVLMIVFDDLNDFIGPLGGHPQAKTPNLNNLAKESVLFANAHSNSPVCSPSRGSFMTGIHPSTSRNYGFKNAFANPVIKNSKTLPQYFQENGYKTYLAGKVFHGKVNGVWDEVGVAADYGPLAYDGKKSALHPSCPPEMSSFGALDSTFARLSDVPSVSASSDAPGYSGWMGGTWGQAIPFKYNTDTDRDLLNDEKSVAWFKKKLAQMEKQKQQEPFFMALGIIRPHTPLVVPDKYFDMFPLDQIQVPERQENDLADTNYHQGGPKDSRGAQIYQALKANSNGTDEGLRRYTQAYLASIAFADDMLGQAMSALENSAYKDNTIVVVFSDHGYQIGEKDHLWKYTLWEDSTHVPFIIKHPKYKHQAGKQVQHPISLIDVFPTLKDFCDLQGPTKLNESGAELDGFSLKSFLENPETESWNGPDFAMTITDSYKSKLPKDQHIAIRTKHYRYIHYQNGTEELYDHRRDSNEWTNLASNPEYAQIKKQLKNDMFESLKNKKEPVITSKSNKTKSDAEKWKDTYFKKNPAADTNKDGVLSWPEYKKHKE